MSTTQNKHTARSICFLLLVLLALAGCSAKEKPTGEIPEHTPLARCQAQEGELVLVKMHGAEQDAYEDMAANVTASLQSEIKLRAARSEQDADILVDMKVNKIYLAASDKRGVSGSSVLFNTVAGTSLGMIAGGLIGGTRTGVLIGSGVGAGLGLGVSAADSVRLDTWAIDADIEIRRGAESQAKQHYTTTVAGKNMDREQALEALGTALGRDLVRAMR